MSSLSETVRLLLANVKDSHTFSAYPLQGEADVTQSPISDELIADAKKYIFDYGLVTISDDVQIGTNTRKYMISENGEKILEWLNSQAKRAAKKPGKNQPVNK